MNGAIAEATRLAQMDKRRHASMCRMAAKHRVSYGLKRPVQRAGAGALPAGVAGLAGVAGVAGT